MGKERKVSLEDIGWAQEALGTRTGEEVEDARWAVVEYAEGSRREEWCEEGHRGYVLRGAIEYEFDDGRQALTIPEGQALLLPSAPLGGGAHRERNLFSGVTQLFLIDDHPEAAR